MAGVTMTLESAKVERMLASLAGRLANPQPLMAELGEILISQTQDSFERQKAPDGTPWEPSQRALADGGQTLVDDGLLLGSLDKEALPESIEVGSNKLYACIHQFGGLAGRGLKTRLPARPFMPDDDTVDDDAIERAVERYLQRAVH